MKRLVAVWLLASGLVAGGANAGSVAVTFAQVGSDVVITAAGSLTATTTGSTGSSTGVTIPSNGYILFGNTPSQSNYAVGSCTVSPTTQFGTANVPIFATAFSGTVFGIDAASQAIYLPIGFTGGAINSTITIGNTQLPSLGITSGGVTYTCGANTITVGVPAPTVTLSTASLAINASSLTITGTGFDTTVGNNTVAFNLGAAGTVSAATATQLTVTLTSPPTSIGNLTAVVTTNAQSSGSAVQVATVASAPASIPSLSEWTKLMLVLMVMTLLGWHFRRQQV